MTEREQQLFETTIDVLLDKKVKNIDQPFVKSFAYTIYKLEQTKEQKEKIQPKEYEQFEEVARLNDIISNTQFRIEDTGIHRLGLTQVEIQKIINS